MRWRDGVIACVRANVIVRERIVIVSDAFNIKQLCLTGVNFRQEKSSAVLFLQVQEQFSSPISSRSLRPASYESAF